ncbi:MAG: hypothetical protein U1F30_16525 [Steroidobacteraceae bacterium]
MPAANLRVGLRRVRAARAVRIAAAARSCRVSAAYEARIAEFRAFDPELVIAFGADHYDGLHPRRCPRCWWG